VNANVGKELVRAGMIDLRAQPVSDMRNFQFQAIVTLMGYPSHSLEIDQREYGEHVLIVKVTISEFACLLDLAIQLNAFQTDGLKAFGFPLAGEEVSNSQFLSVAFAKHNNSAHPFPRYV
jgi:hypothetical protein